MKQIGTAPAFRHFKSTITMIALFSGIHVGSWHLAGQDFRRKRSRKCWAVHVGMIANAAGNKPSRLLHNLPN
jgi:hypothetical protein